MTITRNLLPVLAILSSTGAAEPRRDVRQFLIQAYPQGKEGPHGMPVLEGKPILDREGEIARGERVSMTAKWKSKTYEFVVTGAVWHGDEHDYRYFLEIWSGGVNEETMYFVKPGGENQAECSVGRWKTGNPWIVFGLGNKISPRQRCKES